MWVRFLKADKARGFEVGKIKNMLRSKAKILIEQNRAFEYTGGFPAKKMKINLKDLK